jgi:hypothetical protein
MYSAKTSLPTPVLPMSKTELSESAIFRIRFMNKRGKPGRYGPVAWVGTGTIFSNYADSEKKGS